MSNGLIAPSLLAVWDACGGDYDTVVERGLQALTAGADWLHVDVMDGVMVPAKTFGAEMVEKLRAKVDGALLDVHLMMDIPDMQCAEVGKFVEAGAGRVVFHPSFCRNVGGALELVARGGAVAGLALDVDEGVELLAPWVGKFAQVLIMTVKAGAGGQSFMPEMLEKVRAVRSLCGPEVTLVIDGGVKAEVAQACWEAGADVLVAGSAVFGKNDLAAVIELLRLTGFYCYLSIHYLI